MKKRFLPYFFFLFLLSGVIFPAATRAESLVADDLVRVGIEHFNKGEYREAIHELSKALMADPKNEQAKIYLKKMGIQEGLYGRQHPPLEQVAELGEQVVGYEKKVATLADENQRAHAAVEQLTQEKENIEKAIQLKMTEAENIRKLAESQAAQSQAKAVELRAKAEAKTKEVVRLNSDLYELKSRLAKAEERLNSTQSQWQEAREENRRRSRQREQEIAQERMEHENSQRVLEKESESIRHQSQESQAQMQGALDETHKQLLDKTNQVDLMRDQVVLANYRMARFEQMVAVKERANFDQEQALSQLQAKFSLLEKNLQEQYAARAAQPQEKPTASTVQFIKNQDRQIAALKQDLLKTREQLQQGQVSSQNQAGTADLKKELSEMSAQLTQMKSLYKNKKSDYQILEKRLKGLQERLGVVEEMLKSRDAQMKEIEQQTDDLLKAGPDKR